ncbi:MAG: hypothetical protein V3S71_06475 [Acidobacteriota bacterium]
MNRRGLMKILAALPLAFLPWLRPGKFAGLDVIGPCHPWKPGDRVIDYPNTPRLPPPDMDALIRAWEASEGAQMMWTSYDHYKTMQLAPGVVAEVNRETKVVTLYASEDVRRKVNA